MCSSDLPKRVAILGAGGTARAAMTAAKRVGAEVTIFNRSKREFPVEPLENIAAFAGDLIIDTLPAGVTIELPDIKTIRAAYADGNETGLALLHAQAKRQNEIFIEATK